MKYLWKTNIKHTSHDIIALLKLEMHSVSTTPQLATVGEVFM